MTSGIGLGNSVGAVSGQLSAAGKPQIGNGTPPPMKTLIYSPAARIIIADGNRQYDVSGDLVNGGVLRPENAVASLQFTLNNKNLRYNGLFDRMDRVILFLKRIKTIQVFSGYLDDVPYLQLYPGTVTFRASCTMKRLLHTWWDPTTVGSQALFGGSTSRAVVGDGTSVDGMKPIGSILRDLLIGVGGWDANQIHIEDFPQQMLTLVQQWMATNQASTQASVDGFRQLMLGDDHSLGVGASASANPALVLGPTAAGTPSYIATMINVADAMGLGPTTDDLQLSQQVAQAAEQGTASRDAATQAAFKALQASSQNWNSQYRNVDAAILALACAMAESNVRILANPGVPESYNYYHDGDGTNGTSVGLYQQISGGQWGDVAQRMNAEASTRGFLLALERIDWKNMDGGAAIQAVQQSAFPGNYTQYVQPATLAIQAARAAIPDPTTVTYGSASAPLSPAQVIGSAAGITSMLPGLGTPAASGSSPTSASALLGASKPNPDAMGAIACGMTYIGSPYSQIRPPVRGVGVDCIAEGSLIMTARGPVPIEQITSDDEVLTRKGYRRVLSAWKVRDNAPVVELFVDGRTLQGTPDHRVWTENRGWVPLAEVTAVDTLVLCHGNPSPGSANSAESSSWGSREGSSVLSRAPKSLSGAGQRSSTSTASRSIATQIPTDPLTGRTSRTLDMDRFMSPSGSITTDATSPRVTKFITSITTRSTTTRPTSGVSNSRSIGQKVRRTGGFTTTSARCAADTSGPTGHRSANSDSVVVSTSRNSTTTHVKQRRSVYDLWVDGEHEFFANGILVHNCSGLTQLAYRGIGLDIGGSTYSQINAGVGVTAAQIKPGDLVFPSGMEHVVMYLGTGYPGAGGAAMALESSGSGWVQGGPPSPDGPQIKPFKYNLATARAIRHIADFGGWDPTATYHEPSLSGPGTAPGTFGTSSVGTGYGATTAGGSGSEPIARNLFTYQFNYPSFAPKINALFTGERSLINCDPLITMVQALCKATLRNWCSSPTGDFVAWYPDYWGLNGKQAVMNIQDIEMKDVSINLNDYSLITHAYVAMGAPTGSGQSMGPEGWLESGVASVENEALYQQMIKIAPGLQTPMTGHDILTKFGARPFMQEYDMVQNSELRQLLAIHHFMEGWTNQFATNVSFTFMPELFPGMRINLVGHNLVVYVTSVQHSFDYAHGFTTQATITAPSVPNGVSQVNQAFTLAQSALQPFTDQVTTGWFG